MTSNPEGNRHFLSKSGFMRGLQCPKALYLRVYNPELGSAPSNSRQSAFESGEEVGRIAHRLFPGGVEILFEEDQPLSIQVEKTKAAIREGAKVIYEAAFSHEGVFCKVDILIKTGRNWKIHEVKSATEVKNHYLDDVALQYFVLKWAGLDVSKAHLVLINNQYVRQGELEPEKLFNILDVTGEVEERRVFIPEQLGLMRLTLEGELPDIKVGDFCTDPHPCDFFEHCWQGREESRIFSLRGSGRPNVMELFNKGITTFEQIKKEGIYLAPRKSYQLEAHLAKSFNVEKEPVKEFLKGIQYPVYFLDFETFHSAIPPFDGTRPYQQIPFQYSLHSQKDEGGPLGHDEYLAQSNQDPRKEILERLLEKVKDAACIIAYNKTFENGVLENLAEEFPRRKKEIEMIQGKLFDIMVPFQKRWVYHWEMEGSHSLKSVIPVLAPDCSYGELDVQDGGAAMEAYHRMCAAGNPDELQKIRDGLLAYCKQDTLATVRLLDVLREISK